MEKFFEGEELTHDDKVKGLTIGLAEGLIVPVFAVSGLTGVGVDLLLDFIVKCAPAPKAEEGADDGSLAAICFKTVADPFIGKLNYFKVISGAITQGSTVTN